MHIDFSCNHTVNVHIHFSTFQMTPYKKESVKICHHFTTILPTIQNLGSLLMQTNKPGQLTFEENPLGVFQVQIALAALGVITSLVAQHMYSLPPYAFLAQDFTTQAALYVPVQMSAYFQQD